MRTQYDLVIAGGGGWKHEHSRYRDAEGVQWLGKVTDDQLVGLYNQATVFAYPSLAEGFGLPIVEAMACGTPVLTSGVSSLIEVGGEAAVTVNPLETGEIRSALETLLNEESVRKERTVKGLQRAADFSWKETAHQVLNLYDRLLMPPRA